MSHIERRKAVAIEMWNIQVKQMIENWQEEQKKFKSKRRYKQARQYNI